MEKTTTSITGRFNHPCDSKDEHIRQFDSLTVAELERASGVPGHVIRYYTRVGLLKPGRNPGNEYKLFGPLHLNRLLFIRRAKSLGYSLEEIKEIYRDAEMGKSPCPLAREIIENRVWRTREKLDSLLSLQKQLEKAVRTWEDLPGGIPDGDCICHLIETTRR